MIRILVLFTLILTTLVCLTDRADAQDDTQDDTQEHRSCSVCGMDRKAYGYSRMLITYHDGTQTGVCSLHCAVSELDSHKDRPVSSLLVADRDTRRLIDSGKAVWVMGGKKRGVMTQRPKWAFGTEEAARSFIAANGGVIASWAEVQAAAREEIVHKSH
ncbi:MAG: nitrous oxide reductase accessory protein NosL [Pelobacteraceae bacterium]